MSEGTTKAVLFPEDIDALAEIALARGIPASQLIDELIAEGLQRDFSRLQSPSAPRLVH